jgi:predicted dehydrogenase
LQNPAWHGSIRFRNNKAVGNKEANVMKQQRVLRHAIIGVGAGILGAHRPALEVETARVVAASDVDAARGQQKAEELGCPFFADHREMLAETRPDVAVILAPHPFHAPLAIDCLQAGCHVLVEKPLAVQVAEADRMIETATRAGRLLAVNFQQRFRPDVQAARKLIQSGELGQIQHVDMTQTWTRTVAYYNMASWRGTWEGEGGGVLMNQAPHNLDLLCYLLGLPSKLVAWTRTLIHSIETEDTVQAMLEWPNGALGSIHISTAQAGQPQRLTLGGTKGVLQLGEEGLTFHQFETDLRDFVAHNPGPYSAPTRHPVAVELELGVANHVPVYRNLHAAILHGEPLRADGTAGCMSLELANAMIYSSHTHQEVTLPLDRGAYAALLDDLKASSHD